MSNICVIGGSGFIGSYLLKLLVQDHSVVNIDKKPNCPVAGVKHVQTDIRDLEQLRNVFPDDIDTIINLAAEHADDVYPTSLYYDVNVEGTRNITKIMDERNIKNILFTSSVSIYGINKAVPPVETTAADPFNHYGISKYKGEEVLRQWVNNNSKEKSLIILRPTVVFGPGNRGNVYNLLKQISSGRFMMVGNGENKKSMAYVENVAGFIAYCINKNFKGYHLFNYIDKPDLSTKELVSHAEKALGKRIIPVKIPYWAGYALAATLDVVFKILNKKNPLSAVRVQKFCATTQFNSLTVPETGFKAPVPLSEGLSRTIKSILADGNTAMPPKPVALVQAEV